MKKRTLFRTNQTGWISFKYYSAFFFLKKKTQRFVSWHYFQERLKSRIYLIFIKRVSEASGDIGRNRSGVCLETRVYLTPRRRRHKFSEVACFLKLTEMRFFSVATVGPTINLINFALKAENLFHFRNLLFLAFLLLGCFFARLTKSLYGKKIFIWIRGTSATDTLETIIALKHSDLYNSTTRAS